MKPDNITSKNKLAINGKGDLKNRGFLKTRDNDFDTTKSFLIVSMVVAHSFQKIWFSPYGIYDRNLTYYVLFGFVFLSGLTLGGVFYDKLLSNRWQVSWQVFSRGLKLLFIFILANVFIMLLNPYRLNQLLSSEPGNIFLALINSGRGGNYQTVSFSFVVLIPISLTFMLGPTLLIWKNQVVDGFLLGLGIIALSIIDTMGYLDYYAVKFMIIGCIGVLLAKFLNPVNWLAKRATLSKWVLQIFICYIMYQSALVILNPHAQLLATHYTILTILLLLAVYLASYRLKLTSFGIVEHLNRSLAKYMLFAYLFHISFLNIILKLFSRGNLYFTIFISSLTLAVTILVGLIVDALTKKYKTFDNLYALIFK